MAVNRAMRLTDGDEAGDPKECAITWRNDAFSFWKLPENWVKRLADATDESDEVVRRYLYEEYPVARRAGLPSSVQFYYKAVRNVIPPKFRTWVHYAAVK